MIPLRLLGSCIFGMQSETSGYRAYDRTSNITVSYYYRYAFPVCCVSTSVAVLNESVRHHFKPPLLFSAKGEKASGLFY